MTPIDIQVSRSKFKVKGHAYSLYVGEGGISVLQTSIFFIGNANNCRFQVSYQNPRLKFRSGGL